jgi:peptidoglycan hydrolase-like protein with peptidoglycan-binding domain
MTTLAAPAKTVAVCNFTRNLELGVTGDDVLCLQKYLNANGYQIAATGAGSPGRETGEYKALTEAAVIKWQKANKLAPAIGYFGAQSRLFFKNGGTSAVANAGTPAVNAPLIQVRR